MPKVHITIDDDDWRDLCREVAFRQRIRRPLPDGESDKLGGHIGEIVRDLWEYRGGHPDDSQFNVDWPENTPGIHDEEEDP